MPAGHPEATLYVSDLRRSTRFYAAVLGFTFEGYLTADSGVVADPNAEGDFVGATLRTGGLVVNLLSAAVIGTPAGAAADHVVSVPDLEVVHAALRGQGHTVSDLVEQPWGRRECSVTDPDGYTWTLHAHRVHTAQAQARRRGEITGYISAEEFLGAARAQNLTLQAYLDKVWGSAEGTPVDFAEGVLATVALFGVFEQPIRHVVEIGTGVGMYVPVLQQRCQPESYESYEPEPAWADWLAREYGVLSQDCDGVSLRPTPTASADLVHAHGVFVALPFLTSVQYFRELGRVLRPGGHAVFDILSEACMTDTALSAWLESDARWPVVLSKDQVTRLLAEVGLVPVGDFLTPAFDAAGRCQTHYLLFRKT